MPQMAPYNWLIMYMLFNLMLMYMISFIHFYNYQMISLNKLFYKKMMFKFKW